jgi:hypothetical protein
MPTGSADAAVSTEYAHRERGCCREHEGPRAPSTSGSFAPSSEHSHTIWSAGVPARFSILLAGGSGQIDRRFIWIGHLIVI